MLILIGEYPYEVFPNPTTDFLSINFEETLEEDTDILILTSVGELVRTEIAMDGDKELVLNVTDLTSGNYVLIIKSKNLVSTKKFVKAN